MILKRWEELPDELRVSQVRPYYESLQKKRASLFFKRTFDVSASLLLLLLFLPVFLILAVAIKVDSRGPVFYRQTRVTRYYETFRIFKFRSMVVGADRGSQVTVCGDDRITRVGRLMRRFRLDEIPQLIDVLRGKMTFVGTRPEVPHYTSHYTPEMMATFLLPAGVTSQACIYYKDESELLLGAGDADDVYIHDVLPGKMEYNLREIREYSFLNDLRTMWMTVMAMFGREYARQPGLEENNTKESSLL